MANNETADSFLPQENLLWRGIASLFDFNGSIDHRMIEEIRTRYHSPPPILSSEDAIRSTWQDVGDTMRWAIGEYAKELDETLQE